MTAYERARELLAKPTLAAAEVDELRAAMAAVRDPLDVMRLMELVAQRAREADG